MSTVRRRTNMERHGNSTRQPRASMQPPLTIR
jgi:hypothetical protein